MTTLNDISERELTLEDEGYDSASKSLSIPTPLRRISRIHHISTNEDLFFIPTTPLTSATWHLNCTSMCCHLSFISSDEESTSSLSSPLHSRTEPSSLEQHSMDYQHPSPTNTQNSFHDTANGDDEEDFFHSHTGWHTLAWGSCSRQTCMYPWKITATFSVFLPLPLQPGPAITQPRIYSSITLLCF